MDMCVCVCMCCITLFVCSCSSFLSPTIFFQLAGLLNGYAALQPISINMARRFSIAWTLSKAFISPRGVNHHDQHHASFNACYSIFLLLWLVVNRDNFPWKSPPCKSPLPPPPPLPSETILFQSNTRNGTKWHEWWNQSWNKSTKWKCSAFFSFHSDINLFRNDFVSI